jgi:CCR4-NOT transcription complex subunit 4
MSVLNLSGDEAPECPLCMELLELDDISFYPCICGYQVNTYIFSSMLDSANGSLTY